MYSLLLSIGKLKKAFIAFFMIVITVVFKPMQRIASAIRGLQRCRHAVTTVCTRMEKFIGKSAGGSVALCLFMPLTAASRCLHKLMFDHSFNTITYGLVIALWLTITYVLMIYGALIFAFMGPHAAPAVLKTWGYSCLFELFGIEGVRLLAFKTAASFLMTNIDAMIYNDNSISSWYEGHFASHMQVQYRAIAAVGSIHELLKGLHIQGEYNSMDRLEFRYRDRKQKQDDDTVGDDYDFDIDLDMEMDA